MEITLYRDHPLSREHQFLPGATYNQSRTLLARSATGAVFVPIRSMQYLAILDREEIVFVDHQFKSQVVIAWQNFRPQARTTLDESVAFETLIYQPDGKEIRSRLQGEFAKALQVMAAKDKVDGPAKILKFHARAEQQ